MHSFLTTLRGIFSGKVYVLLMILALFLKSEVLLALTGSTIPHASLAVVAFYGLITVSGIAFVLSPGLLLSRRKQHAYLLGVNILLSIIFLGDVWYYRAFANFLSFHTLLQAGNLENLSGSILAMIHLPDILLVIDIPVFLYFFFRKNTPSIPPKRSYAWFAVMLFGSAAFLFVADRMYMRKTTNPLFAMAWIPNKTLADASPIGYHAIDLYEFIRFGKLTLTPELKQSIDEWYSNYPDASSDSLMQGIFKGKNLLILQVESLENFVIHQQYVGQEITPNLNRIARQSLYFTNFYDGINNGGSADADLLANTSIYPPRKGSSFLSFPNNTYNSLPKILARYGYHSLAVKSDKGNYYNWKPALTAMGFDECYDATKFKRDDLIGMGLSDSSYLHQMVPYIRQLPQPFYAFAVTLTLHSPFDLPAEKRKLTLPTELNNSRLGGYLQSAYYTDKFIGEFLNRLDSAGILENTVVVVYGDHSSIHRYFTDEVVAMKPPIPWSLDASGRIPLMIYHKNFQGREIATFSGQVDIMPTVLPLLGVPRKEYAMTAMGRDILNSKKNFTFLTTGKCVGIGHTADDEKHAIRTLQTADAIVRSNYFGERKK